MYPNSQHVDEPTMTDLRGVLPGQRPPIDARVLDEPTSEVPIITPAGPVDAEPEPAPEPEPAAVEPATEAGYLDHAEATEETDAAEPEVEPAAQPETEADLVAEFETGAAAPPAPAFTPPMVPSFGAETTTPTPPSEMAKMAWSPAPPPGLVPAASTSLFEPTPPATEPEPVGLEPVAEVETAEVEVADVEAADVVALEPETVAPEAVAPEPVEPEIVEPEAAEQEAGVTELIEPAVAEPDIVEPEAQAVTVDEPEARAQTAEPEPVAIDEPAPEVVSRAPGEVPETPIALWSDEATQGLHDQWRDLQVLFFDDPNAAVAGAKDLVTDAVRELADTLLTAQAALDPFRGGDRVDTEAMRVAMRRYREFLDRVLAL